MTTPKPTRYEAAIKRNLDELHNAILERMALIALLDLKSVHAQDYFRISKNALFNDMVAHTIKVFERNKKVASFWYINNKDDEAMNRAAVSVGSSTEEIESLIDGLKHIRDKTHFHISKEYVQNPQRVWTEADVKGDDLGLLLELGSKMLIHIYKEKTGKDYPVDDYDGSDVRQIVEGYIQSNPDAPILL